MRHLIDARLLTSFEGPAEEEVEVDDGSRSSTSRCCGLGRVWCIGRARTPRARRLRDQLRQATRLWEERGRPDGSALEQQLLQGIRALARTRSRTADGHRGSVRPRDVAHAARRSAPPAFVVAATIGSLLLVVGLVDRSVASRPLLRPVAPRLSSSSPWGSSSLQTTRAWPSPTPLPAWREPTRPRCGASGMPLCLARRRRSFSSATRNQSPVTLAFSPDVDGSPKSGSSRVSRCLAVA